jgi:uncharacterized protein (TIGR02996 family)
MSAENQLWNDVLANPSDKFTRGVLADWLGEHDQHDLAETLRAPASVEKVQALSASQRALLTKIVDHWIACGLQTGSCAETERLAEAAVVDAYRVVGLGPPKTFIWFDSPLRGAIAATLITEVDQAPDQVLTQAQDQVRAQAQDQVWNKVLTQMRDQVLTQVLDQVQDQVWNKVWSQVLDRVRDQVLTQVRDQVLTQVRDQVLTQVRDQVLTQVLTQVRDQVHALVQGQVWRPRPQCGYGHHDTGWLSFYAFFGVACGVDVSKLAPLMRLAHLAGWWWPFQETCIMTRRPIECVMRRNKLVRVTYADGFGVGCTV